MLDINKSSRTPEKPSKNQCRKYRIVGLPGTGKTTSLIKMVGNFLNEGYAMKEIVYCSFTNAAVNEAKDRVQQSYNCDKKEMIWFRTIHSLCRKLINLPQSTPVRSKHMYDHFNEFRLQYDMEIIEEIQSLHNDIIYEPTSEMRNEVGLGVLSITHLCNNPAKWLSDINNYILANHPEKYSDIQRDNELLEKVLSNVGITRSFRAELQRLIKRYLVSWLLFKAYHNLFEFDELLFKVFVNDITPKAKVLIIDEFQDSSYLQNKLIEMWSKKMDILVIAGDPNQAIYSFNGATPMFMTNYIPTCKDYDILLNQSYRLPTAVVEYAKKILGNNPGSAWAQTMCSGTGVEGEVLQISFEKAVEIALKTPSINSVFILARTNYIAKHVSSILLDQNIYHVREGLKNYNKIVEIVLALYQGRKLHFHDVNFLLKQNGKMNAKLFGFQEAKILKQWVEDNESDKKINGKQILNEAGADVLLSFLSLDTDDLKIRDITNILKKLVKPQYREYFLKLEEGTEDKLTKETGSETNFEVMTIHASKGREADMIILCNLGSYYELKGKLLNPDEERRVFYVAATRTRKVLAIADVDISGFEETEYLPPV